jgi:hypothetical protein
MYQYVTTCVIGHLQCVLCCDWSKGLRIRLFNLSLKLLTCALYVLRVYLEESPPDGETR